MVLSAPSSASATASASSTVTSASLLARVESKNLYYCQIVHLREVKKCVFCLYVDDLKIS